MIPSRKSSVRLLPPNFKMSPPNNNSLWPGLPPEIWYTILSAVPDLLTLIHLMLVFPHLEAYFAIRYRELFADILGNSSSFQISKLASYVLFVRHGTPPIYEYGLQKCTSKDILRTFLENDERPCVTCRMDDPVAALVDLAALYDETDCWTDAFILQRCCQSRLKTPAVQGPERRASPTELYRVRRALWRIWALCESANTLSESRQPTVNVYAVNDFFEGITPWELEEMECLYLFLRDEYRSLSIHIKKAAIDHSITIHYQAHLLRRLRSTMGYWLEPHFTAAVESKTPWTILYYFAMVKYRPTFYRPQTPLTIWSDAPAGANSQNEGWRCYSRNSATSPWPRIPTSFHISGSDFQEWGYCIWDQERLDDWKMLDGDGK